MCYVEALRGTSAWHLQMPTIKTVWPEQSGEMGRSKEVRAQQTQSIVVFGVQA